MNAVAGETKTCFHTPHSMRLNNSMSRCDAGEPDAAQTFFLLSVRLCNNNLIAFLLLTSSALCVEQRRCSLAADYQTPNLCSVSDVSPLSHMHNNVPKHAGVPCHFRAMARSLSFVTSQGAGLYVTNGTVGSMTTRGIKQSAVKVRPHRLTTNIKLSEEETFFKAFSKCQSSFHMVTDFSCLAGGIHLSIDPWI